MCQVLKSINSLTIVSTKTMAKDASDACGGGMGGRFDFNYISAVSIFETVGPGHTVCKIAGKSGIRQNRTIPRWLFNNATIMFDHLFIRNDTARDALSSCAPMPGNKTNKCISELGERKGGGGRRERPPMYYQFSHARATGAGNEKMLKLRRPGALAAAKH